MNILPDGSVFLEEGEPIPLSCPKCYWPKAFTDDPGPLTCERCHYEGPTEEFSKLGWKKDPSNN